MAHPKMMKEIARHLSQRRWSLLQQVTENQDEMKAILEEPESEFEESAQRDGITDVTHRLTQRDRQKLRDIDAAFERLQAGTYGKCEDCEEEIAPARLRALPTTTLCIDCAAARESKKRLLESEDSAGYLRVRDRVGEEE
jgi:DnaK suppressor protein